MSGDEEQQNVPVSTRSAAGLAARWRYEHWYWDNARARPKRTHSFVWSLGCPHGGAMDGWDRTKMTNDLDCSLWLGLIYYAC